MGLFDRFKKKEDNKQVEEKKTPLTLKYSDGTVAEITFNGSVEIDGKMLHSAKSIYYNSDGTFEARDFLLEPITSKGSNGLTVDSTEDYYKWMAQLDGTVEGNKRYSVTKGFFKKQETTKKKMGSDYIGNVAQKEDGSYFRYFDEDFKRKRIEYTKQLDIKEEKSSFSKNLKDNTYPPTDVTAYIAAEETRLKGPLTMNDPANRDNNTEER